MNISFCCTSINPYSEILVSNALKWEELGGDYFISLDRKSGDQRDRRVRYVETSRATRSEYERICPLNSYSRKNISFIDAAQAGAAYIFETDDDNIVEDHDLIFDNTRALSGQATGYTQQGHINLFEEIYSTEDQIWARGFPVKWLEDRPRKAQPRDDVQVGVVQFLVRGNPDVDAIFRLVKSNDIDLPVRPEALPRMVFLDFHPFNSQATLWPARHYPLCYLPSTCSFRMTDIWRGYVAQRILYERGEGVKFEQPAVTQVRNDHKIYRDFFDEHLGYVQSEIVIETLQQLEFSSTGLTDMVMEAYAALVAQEIFKTEELKLLEAYLAEVSA